MSQFRVVSMGLVAENKKLSSKDILVTPIEDLSFLDGEILSNPEDTEVSFVDANEKTFNDKIKTDNTLTATWLALCSTNRRTAPDVRRGERVLIWQAADSDKYYWTSCGQDDHLRKLETVIYTFSDTTDESKDSTALDCCYYLEVSTHNKQVTFHTASANGEPFEYTFQFNTAEGVVTLADDVGNFIEFDSAETKITAKNRMGTFFSLDKKNIIGHAEDKILLDAPNMFRLTVGGSFLQMTPGETILKTPKFTGQR